MFALRLGQEPRLIVTTTPRPTKLVKDLVSAKGTILTTGSTYENKDNLAPSFIEKLKEKYEGTRLGRQELHAEILTDNPWALWKRQQIEDNRLIDSPNMKRIVVAIDPAATSNTDADETGIVVAGIGSDDKGYLLADISMRGTPEEWARAAINAYHEYKADRIIGETNNGGEMIETLLRMVDKNVSYKGVHASRGKITRAEPISALYEQGKCRHVGYYPVLEDQMCEYDPKTSKFSPDRMDALVWAFTELMTEPGVSSMLEYYSRYVNNKQ